MSNETETKKKVKKKVKFKIDFKKLFKNPLFYVTLLNIIATVFIIYSVISIGVLGVKFLIPIILGIIVIDFISIFFLFRMKKRKGKIILSILSVFLSIIYFVLGFVLTQVYSSIDNMFKNDSSVDYSILALKKSNFKKVDDIDGKIIGFYVDDKYNEVAQEELNKDIEAEYVGYSSVNELKNALITKEVDALMIMDSLLEVGNVTDEVENDVTNITDTHKEISAEDSVILENIENFDEDSKVIYSFKIKVDNSHKTKKINLDKGSFVIYVSGQDSYANSVSETSRSDVNLLMVVNIKTRQVLLLSIPRDYYVPIATNGQYDKLTHISLYGSEVAAQSIGNVLGIDVDYYVKFNFTTFMKAVEYLLPLDVYSDYSFETGVYDQTIGRSYSFSKGYNNITNGEMALQFVRARKNFNEGDRQRGINQARFLKAVIKKASSPSVLLKYNKILKSLEGTFLTNIDNQSIIDIIKYIINNNGTFKINSISLNGSDASRPTYSGGSQPLYVMIPDKTTIEDAKVHIKTILDGGIPNIEEDAADLEDPKNSHTVTSKDIGKTYGGGSYVKPNKPKEEIIVEPQLDNEDLEQNNDKEEGGDEIKPPTNPETPGGDSDLDKPPTDPDNGSTKPPIDSGETEKPPVNPEVPDGNGDNSEGTVNPTKPNNDV